MVHICTNISIQYYASIYSRIMIAVDIVQNACVDLMFYTCDVSARARSWGNMYSVPSTTVPLTCVRPLDIISVMFMCVIYKMFVLCRYKQVMS